MPSSWRACKNRPSQKKTRRTASLALTINLADILPAPPQSEVRFWPTVCCRLVCVSKIGRNSSDTTFTTSKNHPSLSPPPPTVQQRHKNKQTASAKVSNDEQAHHASCNIMNYSCQSCYKIRPAKVYLKAIILLDPTDDDAMAKETMDITREIWGGNYHLEEYMTGTDDCPISVCLLV